MSLVVVGLSHHTSPVALREQMAFATDALPSAHRRLHKQLDGAGVVILSTCNRVEVYVHHSGIAEEVFAEVRAFLSESKELPEAEFQEALYEFDGSEAVGHLFRVCASLDSLVVGEAQILGQVHDAFLAAQAAQTTDKVINALFQKAFAVAKRVRTQSSIGAGKVSVSSVAVELAVSIFTELAEKTVMVIGSGETAELTMEALRDRGVRKVIVVNRTPERAKKLVDRFGGEAHAGETSQLA